MGKHNAPLFNALVGFKNKEPISFHVPGHKNGTVFGENSNNLYKDLLKIDLTELTGLDDLHHPEGVIAEAQQLTADLYGVKKSYFLVNGSTVGNLAMVLSICRPGDRIIVQRNCHKSIMNALALAKAKPVFVAPLYDSNTSVYTGVHYLDIQDAIEKYPDSKAIVLTNPNYYGTTLDISTIIEYAHRKKIPVLVDEAHGAHYCLGDPFPASAISFGADIVVHSAHKTLPAMTMGSYLHYNSNLIAESKVSYYLSVLQSSSPSYPIMASLDYARWYVEHLIKSGFQSIIRNHLEFRYEIEKIPNISVVEGQIPGSKADPLKIIVQLKNNISGYELKDRLEQVGIYPELADFNNVLLILPLAIIQDKSEIVEKIRQAIRNATSDRFKQSGTATIQFQTITESAIAYDEMETMATKSVTLEDAESFITAEDIIPYPPGIPLLLKGEIIKEAHIDTILNLLNHGIAIQGSSKIKQKQISVFI